MTNSSMTKICTYLYVMLQESFVLELVQNLTTTALLNRFCAKHGIPKIINSDNSKTFQSSGNLLR